MKYRKKIVHILVLAVMFTLMFAMVAYADDAVEDILKQPRFGGAVTWVNKIGSLVDEWFMAAISFVSFFIISASCLRNVLAGAYCVFPKFWDGVHEAHQMTSAISIASVGSYFTGGGYKNTNVGSISKFLMGLLPDIKVLTDFEGAQDVDYKQYFMKAIPQCVIAVFVGVFIYNGYYRDVMVVTSRFGSHVTMNALMSIKPEQVLETLTNVVVNIQYPIKDASYGTDLYADTYLKEVVGYVTGDDAYPDQSSKGPKQKLYDAMSSWCSEKFKNVNVVPEEMRDTELWSMSVDNAGIRSTNPITGSMGGDGLTYTSRTESADKMSQTMMICTPVSELRTLGFHSEYHEESDMFLWATVTFTNKGAKKDDTPKFESINDLVLELSISSERGSLTSYLGSTPAGGSRLSTGNYQLGGGLIMTVNNDSVSFNKQPTAGTYIIDTSGVGSKMTYSDVTPSSVTHTVTTVELVVGDNTNTAVLYSQSRTSMRVNKGESFAEKYGTTASDSGDSGTTATQGSNDLMLEEENVDINSDLAADAD